MIKIYYYSIFLFFIGVLYSNVFAQKTILKLHDTVGEPVKTNNSKTTFIYKNGFDSYEISLMKYYKYNKKKYYELKFNNCYSYSYCTKIMFQNFGKWDQEFSGSYRSHKILIWKNVDLFNNGDKYTVGTFGIDAEYDLSSSVFVLNENGEDFLTQDTKYRSALIKFFLDGIKNSDLNPIYFFLPR